MVTYGPWQEARIHEEIIDAKVVEGGTNGLVLVGEEPTVRSGWRLEFNHAYSALGVGTAIYEQGIEDPPPPSPPLSEAGFTAALDDPVAAGATDLQFRLLHHGENQFLSPPSRWVQTQQWEMYGAVYRLWWDDDLEPSTGTAIYAVPAGFDPFTSDYYVELEGGGTYTPLEVVSAEVLPSTPIPDLGLYVKDADPDAAADFLYSSVAQGGTAGSVVDGRLFPMVGASSLPLDHDALNTLIRDRDPAGVDWDVDGRMPTLAPLYNGPVLNAARNDGSSGYDQTLDGLRVAVRIRYRWPRWRQVFYADETVPYRRIYPRDDSLAGGAGRNYPRPRSVQSSNRTSGYL